MAELYFETIHWLENPFDQQGEDDINFNVEKFISNLE
jgi:hypothetical protein